MSSSSNKAMSYDPSREALVSSVCTGEYPMLEPTTTWYENENDRHTWALTLGAAGFLDILATVLPIFVGKIGACDDASSYDICERHISAAATFPPEVLEFVDWIDQRNVAISLFFSTLWFIDGFLKASSARQRVLLRKERQSLLMHGVVGQTRKWWDASTFVYYRSIAMQLLCLPVGFYFVFFYSAMKLVHGQGIHELNDVSPAKMTLVKNNDYIHYESFSVNSREAFFVAVLEYVVYSAFGVTSREVRATLQRVKKIQTRKLIRKAIRHPWRFRRQVVKVLAWVRYIRYAIPLVGGIKKLHVNIEEMEKRRRQHREAQMLKRTRQLLWGKQRRILKVDEAATVLQCAFRAYRAHKATRALQILRADREYVAIAKIQHILRRKVKEARLRLNAKHAELKRLEKQAQQRLGGVDKLRLYELQDELVNETKKLIDRKMLIRPNRSFVFYWRLLFIVCIAFEIGQTFVKSWVDIRMRKSKKSDTVQFVAQTFVPTRLTELTRCKGGVRNSLMEKRNSGATSAKRAPFDRPWYCEDPFTTPQEFVRDLIALVVIPAPVSDWPECEAPKWYQRHSKSKKPVRWYCNERFHSGHAFYRLVINFLWEELLVIIGVICFLDVFVTFFTGEFHVDNGTLVPKPFFKRWILPGLTLQLLVNPQLGNVSSWTFDTAVKILDNGPVRVYRWSATVAFPLVYLLANLIAKQIWPRFAAYANNHNTAAITSKQTSEIWFLEDAT